MNMNMTMKATIVGMPIYCASLAMAAGNPTTIQKNCVLNNVSMAIGIADPKSVAIKFTQTYDQVENSTATVGINEASQSLDALTVKQGFSFDSRDGFNQVVSIERNSFESASNGNLSLQFTTIRDPDSNPVASVGIIFYSKKDTEGHVQIRIESGLICNQ